MNQFGTLVTMSVEKVGGAQTGLGEILSSAGGKGKSRSESAFQSNSGPVDGCAWSGGMAAYDGDGVGTGSDKGAAMRWGPCEFVVDAEGPKLIGGPEVAGGKLLGRQFSEPVGWRDRGGVPGPNRGDGPGWTWSAGVWDERNSRRCGVKSRGVDRCPLGVVSRCCILRLCTRSGSLKLDAKGCTLDGTSMM